MPRRPCLGLPGKPCGQLTDHPSSRCPGCRRTRDTHTLRAKRQRRPRISHAEEARRAATVTAWRAQHGSVCPGWQRPAHPVDERVNPLTADHEVAVGAGGTEDGPLTVLCRACNGAKADRNT